jgi:Lipase (class 3)
MANLLELAWIADAVYGQAEGGNDSQKELTKTGWTCPAAMQVNDASVFSGGSLTTSGFQGRVFQNKDGNEAIIAYKGTKPSQVSDLVADMKLAMGFVPTQAKDALKATVDWMKQLGKKKFLIVGHSLGGALAQVVGLQTGVNFVTFNAPGMQNQSKGLSSSQSSTGKPGEGLNLRTGGSFAPIAALGTHIGKVEILEKAGAGHSITLFVDYLKQNSKEGGRVPF